MKISKLLKDRIPAKLWYKFFYKEEQEKNKTSFDKVNLPKINRKFN